MQKLEYQLTRPTIQDFIKTVSTAHTHNIIYNNILYHILFIIDVFIYILYHIVLIDILFFIVSFIGY